MPPATLTATFITLAMREAQLAAFYVQARGRSVGRPPRLKGVGDGESGEDE